MEQNSEHPIALGIVRFAEEKGVKLLEVRDFQSLTAQGIQGKIGGKDVLVVSPNYLKSKNIALPESAQSKAAETVVLAAGSFRRNIPRPCVATTMLREAA